MSGIFDPFGGSGNSWNGAKVGWKIGKAISGYFRNRREAAQQQQQEAEHARVSRTVINNPPALHGSASWPSVQELRTAGLLTEAFNSAPAGHGLRVGAVMDRLAADAPVGGLLDWTEEGHILTVAPTRSGKATSLIVPNLLSYRGSAIVLDPKGELFELTSAWRRTNVGPVFRIALFDRGDRKDAAYPCDQFNPLASVRSVGDARAVASLLIPKDPKASDFFNNDAVAFLTAAILYLLEVAPPAARTIPELRRMTSLPLQDFRGMIRRMQNSSIAEVRSGANVVTFKSADRGLPNLIETLNSYLSLWSEPDVIHAVSGTSVDFEAMKDQPATVYVTVPFDRLRPYSPFIKVLLRTALNAMVANPVVPAIPVLFVLDEFLALEDATDLVDAIRTHASAGVRLWFILQDLGTLRKIYGDAGEAVFNTALKIWFGTNDMTTAERLSRELGTATVAHEKISYTVSQSTSRGDPFSHANRTSGTSLQRHVDLHGRPLLTPDEVRKHLSGTLPDATRFAVAQTGPFIGIASRLVPYFRVPWCRDRVGCMVEVVKSSSVARYLEDISK